MMVSQLVKILIVSLLLIFQICPAPQALTISFNATDTGSFLDASVINNGSGIAMIPEGQTEVPVKILIDDEIPEGQATITITLNPDSNTPALYRIDPQANSITLTAISEDGISVSISTTGENDSEIQERTITEGEDVSANIILKADLGSFNVVQTLTF